MAETQQASYAFLMVAAAYHDDLSQLDVIELQFSFATVMMSIL